MSIYKPEENEWVCGYGGRLNHKIKNIINTNGSMGTARNIFLCGKYSDYIPYGYNHSKSKCAKCLELEGKTPDKITDKFTSPDIRIKLNSDYVIIGCMAVTQAGADYLLHNAILDEKYDDVSFPELWIETNSPEEE